MERLTYDDDLFLRMECVLGVPVVNQIVWKFDDLVSEPALETMWAHLAGGPIGRTVRTSAVPGARDGWISAVTGADPVVIEPSIAPDEVGAWIERAAHVALDPLTGPAWKLTATAVSGGASVVSLTASHVVGDGGALTSAAAAALRGPADPADFVSVDSDVETGLRADVRDSAGRIAASASGVGRVLGRAVRDLLARRTTTSSTPATPQRGASQPVTSQPVTSRPGPVAQVSHVGPMAPSTVVVDCPTQQWNDAAAKRGGSGNSLLVGVVLGILTASGRVTAADSVKVSLPVSTRVDGDRRANATSGVSIVVDGGAGYYDDLTPIRVRSKDAFRALANTDEPSTFELTKPLVQLLPDALVRRVAASATAPLCLCSNLGARGVAVKRIGELDATAVAMRSITQNTDVDLLRRTKGGISAWWNDSGTTSTLCVTGLDPDRFPDTEMLRALVVAEYEKWGLSPSPW